MQTGWLRVFPKYTNDDHVYTQEYIWFPIANESLCQQLTEELFSSMETGTENEGEMGITSSLRNRWALDRCSLNLPQALLFLSPANNRKWVGRDWKHWAGEGSAVAQCELDGFAIQSDIPWATWVQFRKTMHIISRVSQPGRRKSSPAASKKLYIWWKCTSRSRWTQAKQRAGCL